MSSKIISWKYLRLNRCFISQKLLVINILMIPFESQKYFQNICKIKVRLILIELKL
jgi:hypothetical protein